MLGWIGVSFFFRFLLDFALVLGERGKEGLRSCHGEGCESFEESADHDPGVIFPGIGRAAVAEGPAEVPG